MNDRLLGKEETSKALYTDSGKLYPNAYHRLKQKQDQATLKWVREKIEGIEKPCPCDSPLCPNNSWDEAIQAVLKEID